jgi:hypothetical protein
MREWHELTASSFCALISTNAVRSRVCSACMHPPPLQRHKSCKDAQHQMKVVEQAGNSDRYDRTESTWICE